MTRVTRLGALGGWVKQQCRSDWVRGPGVYAHYLIGNDTHWLAAGDEYSYMTEDGEEWTAGTSLGTGLQLRSVAYGNGAWTALGVDASNDNHLRAWRSDDGLTWELTDTGADEPIGVSATYGHGQHVHIAVRPFGGYTFFWTSADDGESWSNTLGVPMGTRPKIVTSATGYVIVSEEGIVKYSSNGLSSEARTHIYPYSVKDVASDGSRVVALQPIYTYSEEYPYPMGHRTAITNAVYSDDEGQTWTAVEMPSAGRGTALDPPVWSRIIYTNGEFVAVSEAGKCATSPDGEDWEYVGHLCKRVGSPLFAGSANRLMVLDPVDYLHPTSDWNYTYELL